MSFKGHCHLAFRPLFDFLAAWAALQGGQTATGNNAESVSTRPRRHSTCRREVEPSDAAVRVKPYRYSDPDTVTEQVKPNAQIIWHRNGRGETKSSKHHLQLGNGEVEAWSAARSRLPC